MLELNICFLLRLLALFAFCACFMTLNMLVGVTSTQIPLCAYSLQGACEDTRLFSILHMKCLLQSLFFPFSEEAIFLFGPHLPQCLLARGVSAVCGCNLFYS